MKMQAKKNNHARIALAILPEQRHFTEKNHLTAMLKLAKKAGEAKCDLIAFEENGIHLFVPAKEKYCPVPGPQTEAIGKIAKKYKMYIATGMTGVVKGIQRKLVVLFNRDGDIADIYAKQQLTDNEKRAGAVEGDICKPIETDFGRIAFLICYDTQFPALSQMLGFQRTDLIICPHVGGAGADSGKLIGGAFSSQNHCWLAWVGRYVTSMIDPSGKEIAKLSVDKNLLITDIDFNSRKIIPSTDVPIVDRKEQQYTQARFDHYASKFPAIIAEFPKYPTYNGNRLPLGKQLFELVLRNRTKLRQKGFIDISFPLKCTYTSNTKQAFYIDYKVNADWLLTPETVKFNIPPEGSQKIKIQSDIPFDTEGIYLLRVTGLSDGGDCIHSQRQFSNLIDLPEINIPKLNNIDAVKKCGIKIPLKKDFFDSAARSHSDVKIGFTEKNLIIYAKMPHFGSLEDATKKTPEALMAVIAPGNPEELLFWFQIPYKNAVKYQRREHGFMVKHKNLKWNIERNYSAKQWEALITIPFKELGGQPYSDKKWRFNLERRALIPTKYEKNRDIYIVRTPSVTKEDRTIATEWVCWSPHYTRIDNPKRLGYMNFLNAK